VWLGWHTMPPHEHRVASAVQNTIRAANFWTRATFIYGAYKALQIKEAALCILGEDEEQLTAMWSQHHLWAGRQMCDLCVDLRGFYVKAGQFIGARADVVPIEICQQLALLHDQVSRVHLTLLMLLLLHRRGNHLHVRQQHMLVQRVACTDTAGCVPVMQQDHCALWVPGRCRSSSWSAALAK
jgi:hypothetical protein